jgi:hypothetical protein
MPAHVIFVCLFLNAAIAVILGLGGIILISESGLNSGSAFCLGVAAVTGYTAYVIDKIRRYLKTLTTASGPGPSG